MTSPGARACGGSEVELVTSRFRFGEAPSRGLPAQRALLPVSSASFRARACDLPLKAIEHPLGLAGSRAGPQTSSTCSGSPRRSSTRGCSGSRGAAVFTAHDLLPRRTARSASSGSGCSAALRPRRRPHRARGRETLAELGVDPERMRVIPIPVFPSDPVRRDDGARCSASGSSDPTKGWATRSRRRSASARASSSPATRSSRSTATCGGGSAAEWRLGYLVRGRARRAPRRRDVALFPYRPELDQSARSSRPSAPESRRRVRRRRHRPSRCAFEAGRVVPAGDVEALDGSRARAARRPGRARARACGRRARGDELTWERAAAVTSRSTGSCVRLPPSASDVIDRQLDVREDDHAGVRRWSIARGSEAYDDAPRDEAEERIRRLRVVTVTEGATPHPLPRRLRVRTRRRRGGRSTRPPSA